MGKTSLALLHRSGTVNDSPSVTIGFETYKKRLSLKSGLHAMVSYHSFALCVCACAHAFVSVCVYTVCVCIASICGGVGGILVCDSAYALGPNTSRFTNR